MYDSKVVEKIRTHFDENTGEILRIGGASLHVKSSHPCNDFINKLQPQSDYHIVPFPIKVRKGSDPKDAESLCRLLTECLQFYPTAAERHIFFLVGDECDPPRSISSSILFMQSCRRDTLHNAIHYCSPLTSQLLKTKEIQHAQLDWAFQGNLKTHPCRKQLEAVVQKSKFRGICVDTPSLPRPPQKHPDTLISSYIESINNAKFILCPRGMGLNSIRFFESIAAGRIPVLIADDAKLPGNIRWHDIIIRVPEGDIANLDDYLTSYIAKNDLTVASRQLQAVWLDWFDDINNFISRTLRTKKFL